MKPDLTDLKAFCAKGLTVNLVRHFGSQSKIDRRHLEIAAVETMG